MYEDMCIYTNRWYLQTKYIPKMSLKLANVLDIKTPLFCHPWLSERFKNLNHGNTFSNPTIFWYIMFFEEALPFNLFLYPLVEPFFLGAPGHIIGWSLHSTYILLYNSLKKKMSLLIQTFSNPCFGAPGWQNGLKLKLSVYIDERYNNLKNLSFCTI